MRTITRTQAIHELRSVLRTLIDHETSLCAAVARRNVFCRGYEQWSLEELRRRHPEIDERHPGVDRATFVALANQWQCHRTAVEGGRLPCDLASPHRGASPCAGWAEFYESELARFLTELEGESVRVVPDDLGLPSG